MQQPQLIFDRLIAAKKQAKDIRTAYREALKGSTDYTELTERAKTIREKKKVIESAVKQDMASEMNKLDDLKIDIESEQTVFADAVLATLIAGETVEIKDEYNNTYEPIVKVTMKKV